MSVYSDWNHWVETVREVTNRTMELTRNPSPHVHLTVPHVGCGPRISIFIILILESIRCHPTQTDFIVLAQF
jgi:hypothetical protein